MSTAVPRQTLVDRARENWVRKLIDLSRRNNLLYFRDLKNGTLDLTDVDAGELDALFAGKPLPLTALVKETERTSGLAAAREIWRRAQANLEEKGLETLFLAVGMATWDALDGGRPAEAAVILLPVALEFKGLSGQATLRRVGEPAANLVLLHVLEVEYGVTLDPEALLATDPQADTAEETFDPEPVFYRLQAACARMRGFAIKKRVVLGNFSFQKLAMVKDLRENGHTMAGHDLIAALAGDTGAAQSLQKLKADIDLAELDQVPPENEFLVLDADSSQQRVVATVQRGQSLVIQGPPGTGKSQTIANLIGTLVAEGKRILFVAEKRAALEVVQQRLERVGLGHLALDLHGADLTRREIMARVARNLALVREAPAVEAGETHRRFTDRRGRLLAHVERMHARRAPAGLSVYELQGKLLRLPREAETTVRWREPGLMNLTAQAAQTVEDLLQEAQGFAGLFLQTDPSPWNRATVPDEATTRTAMDLTLRMASDIPAITAEIEALAQEEGMRTPASMQAACELLRCLAGIEALSAKYTPGLFAQDLPAVVRALEPAASGLSTMMAWVINGGFRGAVRILRGLSPSAANLAPADLRADAVAGTALAATWKQWQTRGEAPRPVPGSQALAERADRVLADLQRLSDILYRCDLAALPFDRLREEIRRLHANLPTVSYLAPLHVLEHTLGIMGLSDLPADLRRRQVNPELWIPTFRHAWWASCLDQARLKDPALAAFSGRTHSEVVAEFRLLDRKRIQVAADRVKRKMAEHAIAAMNQFPDQDLLVRREAEKKSRHMPLRKLLATAPDVLTALFPCFMASPLSVSQLMDAGRRYFDVVMFDEASQILPEDAVPSLLRGDQVAVAGDEHQLPPTIFFADGSDGAEEDGGDPAATAGFESFLNLTAALLPQRMLQWHYRSQDETLIAFSNRHIYGEGLVTFPGRGSLQSVEHVLVESAGGDGQEESSTAEVQRVVALILDHARTRPTESLGVITMGIKHAVRLQAALDEALRGQPELEPFFDHQRQDRFFIKNLERVQGDERDAIILSIGYGKDRSGKLPYRFGPLLQEGGHRRLNVAITRARKRMTVVSSFTHMDMDPSRSTKRGVELLRLFLQFAAAHGGETPERGAAGGAVAAFEADILHALQEAGINAVPHLGVSSYKLDLACLHPTKPGRFVLAIECDGETYHAAPTARDRDRLRQQHLEALGWRFHRVWSTDWFLRRPEELERLLTAYREAVAAADRLDASFEAPVAAPVKAVPVAEAVAGGRPARPAVPVRESIQEYTDGELIALVRWIKSDGQLRTEDQIIAEMVGELGFARRGKRIEERVRSILPRT
ncbi:MAG TPA: AAA domain-containing protein [Symbiobacteriaceae bacterium]|nr:AAA domain-containing protein [Symbiobacteriaceae bacterium]